MDVRFYSPVAFEKWDHRASDGRGIGGSETCATEMAWRLARRGYTVTSYAPIPRDCPRRWRGTEWLPLEDADFTLPGLWAIFRDARCLDDLPKTPDQTVWLVCQDESPLGITPERAEKIDRVIALCEWHQRHLERMHPFLKGKVTIGSNGIKLDMMREVEPQERNPHRLMYASSPDRGLVPLLSIFKRVREFVPDAELHCFYGLDNIQKIVKNRPDLLQYRGFATDLKKLLKQPGVTWHGRVGQKQLFREWLKSGIWCYPCSQFPETSCITCMEAQALGAVPVFSPRAALAENVKFGVPVDGDAFDDSLTQARFAAEVVKLCWHKQIQEDIRGPMMAQARAIFGWERQVDQWEAMIHGWRGRFYPAQFAFQLKHRSGRTLNVGCADDPAGLGEFGINLDVMATIPWTGKATKAHILHDARESIPKAIGRFDSVICGDLLEHLTDADAVRVLRNAKAVLNPKGLVIITCPEDHRPTDQQHQAKGLKYIAGESAYHERPITRAIIAGWLKRAGLRAKRWQVIDYGHFEGLGVVAERAKPC